MLVVVVSVLTGAGTAAALTRHAPTKTHAATKAAKRTPAEIKAANRNAAKAKARAAAKTKALAKAKAAARAKAAAAAKAKAGTTSSTADAVATPAGVLASGSSGSSGVLTSGTAASSGSSTSSTSSGSTNPVSTVSTTASTVTSTVTSTAAGTVAAIAGASIYWGGVTGTQFTGDLAPWDMNAVTDFENDDAAGKGESIVPFYDDFLSCPSGANTSSPSAANASCSQENFPWTPFTNIRAHGSIPMLSWGSQTLQDGYGAATADSNFTLANVAAGDYDSYITAWAEKAKAWGHPFFLRFNWEMNGNWFPWGMGTNSNTPAEYVAAWRHVHDIFTAVGATNATWVWCPNVGYSTNLAALYPGDQYVDWTCLDAYNFGTTSIGGTGTWQSWDQLAGSSYNQITQQIAPSKPMMIGEFGSSALGGNQAQWLTKTLQDLPTSYPDIHAIVLFDEDTGGMQWSIEHSSSSVQAFSAGISSDVYANNAYSNLSGTSSGAVPVP